LDEAVVFEERGENEEVVSGLGVVALSVIPALKRLR
jgi:hypothetical protein